jgi:hypothetical protein
MTSVQILSETRKRGVEFKVAGDRLLFRPAEAVPPELLSAIHSHKAELLELLCTPDPVPVNIERLKEAEADFSSLDIAPADVVLCIEDPEWPERWLAYRRTNRHEQGRGDSQAAAVLDLARYEMDGNEDP